jgi:bifunctional DNA-binding transcriptional regulator/antitoxin component of YhaV-PrlF toxin-antitoxin module
VGEITYLNRAAPKTESLRTTVPRSIINQFGLTEYDKLEWILKAEGGELVIIVKPQKGEIR